MAPDPEPPSPTSEMDADPKRSRSLGLHARLFAYVVFLSTTLLVFWQSLEALARMAMEDQRHTHVILMPVIAAGLIGWSWREVFGKSRPAPRLGLPLLLAGGMMFAVGAMRASLPLEIAAIAIVWLAGFLTLFGMASLKAARFPFALLALFVPLPSALLESSEVFLQQASAEVTEVLFRAIGMPMFRDGMQFAIPGVIIEVARECSGIRATIMLVLLALVIGYLFLQSLWSRAILVALVIPISIFKNAIRIVALSWLGTNVSMDFLTGDLHHHGGPVFSLISLALMVPFFLALQHAERRRIAGKRLPAVTIDSGSKAS